MRDSSRIRAKRRCRASPRRARSPLAATRRRCFRRTSVPMSQRCARWGFPAATATSSRAPRARRRSSWPPARRLRRCGSRTRRRSAHRRTRPTGASICRPPISSPTSIARSKPQRRRACSARSSPTRSISPSTIRCLPHPSSATKGRRISRGSLRAPARAASSSSSTAAPRSTRRRPRRKSIRRGRRAKRRQRSRAVTGSIPRTASSRSSSPPQSTPASSTTTSSPSVTATLLFCHQHAWVAQDRGARGARREARPGVYADRRSRRRGVARRRRRDVPLQRQLLPRAEGGYLLVAPAECRENPRVAAYLDALVAGGGPIAEILTFDLRQSMRNGGGPACLRLAVTLTAAERAAIPARVFLDDALAADLERWVRKHYRDRLAPEDLGDPALVDESRRALDELTQILRCRRSTPSSSSERGARSREAASLPAHASS